jgi:blue light- and temperature-responsive anti-repressor
MLGRLNSMIEAANRQHFPLERIIVEATEVEAIGDQARFAHVVNEYRRAGIRLAIDDFGAGHAGLSLLSEFQPDIVKLDMGLARGIHAHGPRQAIVRAIAQVCVDLGIDFVVEGVESVDEFGWFNDQGVRLFQGYLFAKPMFEGMPPFRIPE